jgi:hypothetical protein
VASVNNGQRASNLAKPQKTGPTEPDERRIERVDQSYARAREGQSVRSSRVGDTRLESDIIVDEIKPKDPPSKPILYTPAYDAPTHDSWTSHINPLKPLTTPLPHHHLAGSPVAFSCCHALTLWTLNASRIVHRLSASHHHSVITVLLPLPSFLGCSAVG